MPFFLHLKRFVRMVLTKVLSLLFTLTSAIFAQIGHLEDKNNRRIFAVLVRSNALNSGHTSIIK